MTSSSKEHDEPYSSALERLMAKWKHELLELHEKVAEDSNGIKLTQCQHSQHNHLDASRRLPSMPAMSACSGRTAIAMRSKSSEAQQTLKVRPGYGIQAKKRSHPRFRPSVTSMSFFSTESKSQAHGLGRLLQSWNPESRSRSIYEVASLFMLSYDGILVPFFLAWNISETGVWTFCTWLARLFWTFDLISNFFVAYRRKDAQLETRLGLTARNYLKGGFSFDFLVVSLDWVGAGPTTEWTRLFVRALRLVRGLRQILRALGLYSRWRMTIAAKEHQMASDITLLLVLMMLLNHGIACAFWAVTLYADTDTGASWLAYYNFTPGESVKYEYTTCLHWAVTQFSPGSMEVNPKNSSERIFAIGILILALVLASSFVATIASMVTAYRVSKEEASRKFFQLKTYLKQHRVSPELATVVQLQVANRGKETFMLKMSEVQHLKLLSQTVRDDLQLEINSRHLGSHSFFAPLRLLDEFAIRRICVCLEQLGCSRGDTLFEEGHPGHRLFFLTHGCLTYNNLEGDYINERVLSGTWLGEPALWTMWAHMGTADSVLSSELVCLAAEDLQKVLLNCPEASSSAIADYCISFHSYLLQPGMKLSDLPGAIDYQELMLRLPERSRQALLDCVFSKLEDAARSWGGRAKSFDLLREEIEAGKCNLGLVNQEPVRTVFLVAVELRDSAPEAFGSSESDGLEVGERFLVQVGQLLSGEVKATSPMLPATKRKRDDDTTDLVERVVGKELEEIAEFIEVDWARGFTYHSFIKDSPTYGIRTRYLRTRVLAKLSSGTELKTASINKPWDASAEASKAWSISKPSPLSFWYRQERHTLSQAAEVLGRHSSVVVVATPEEKKCTAKLYIWLNEAEFQILSLDITKSVVSSWVEAIDVGVCRAAANKSLRATSLRRSTRSQSKDSNQSSNDDQIMQRTVSNGDSQSSSVLTPSIKDVPAGFQANLSEQLQCSQCALAQSQEQGVGTHPSASLGTGQTPLAQRPASSQLSHRANFVWLKM